MLVVVRSHTTVIDLGANLPQPYPPPQQLSGLSLAAGFQVVETFVGNAALHVALMGRNSLGGAEVLLARVNSMEAAELTAGRVIALQGDLAAPLDLTRAPFLQLRVIGEFSAGSVQPFAQLLPYGHNRTSVADAPPPKLHGSMNYPSGFQIR